MQKKISKLLNLPLEDVTSVDYQNEKLTAEATKVLEKIFKMLGELELWQIDELDKTVTNMSLLNGVMKYRRLLQKILKKLEKMPKNLKMLQWKKKILIFYLWIQLKEMKYPIYLFSMKQC